MYPFGYIFIQYFYKRFYFKFRYVIILHEEIYASFSGASGRVSLENLPISRGIKTHAMPISVNTVLFGKKFMIIKYVPHIKNMTFSILLLN